MSSHLVSLAGFGVLVVLLVLRVPIGFAMAIAGVVGFGTIVGGSAAINMLGQVTFSTISSYEFSIIPMFILMGSFAARGDLSLELFRAAQSWVGQVRGGLAVASLTAAGGFAAINGSSIATASTMTRVALPEMEREGYHPALSTGVIAAGGTLGIMIPPSAVFALYGFITEQDIGKLFMAGILPGLLGLMMYVCVVFLIGHFRPQLMPGVVRSSWSERWSTLRQVWAVLLLFVLVIGGIYGGIFTAVEASGIGAGGAWLIGILRGRLNLSESLACLAEALRLTASIFVLVIGALAFGYFLTVSGTTTAIIRWFAEQPLPPHGVLVLILIGYLVLGAFMDELAMTLLTLPIVFPVIVSLGFDPIWFGVIFVMVCTLGLIMPPVGMNVFVINSIARHVSLSTIYRGVIPFIISDLLRLVILVLFPGIALYLTA